MYQLSLSQTSNNSNTNDNGHSCRMKYTITENCSGSTYNNSGSSSSGISSANNSVNSIASHNSGDISLKPNRLSAGNSSSSGSNTSSNHNNTNNSASVNSLFCEQVSTVTNLFEKWNDCERTVVMYALLKRMRYPSLKFLQYSIDNTLTQSLGSQPNLSTVVDDMNANNPSYLQNLLNAYKTPSQRMALPSGDGVDALSSSSSDKESMTCYGSDFQLTPPGDERKLYSKKQEILHDVLNMLPLLKPGNDEAKAVYLALIPAAVKDTMHQLVPTELVQQVFSYLLIHPAISNDDRRSLSVWLRHLEDHIQTSAQTVPQQINKNSNPRNVSQTGSIANNSVKYFLPTPPASHIGSNLKVDHSSMSISNSSASSGCSSVSCSSASNVSVSSSMGNLAPGNGVATRSADWQTIAPPSKQNQQKSLSTVDWSSIVAKPGSRSSVGSTGSRGSIGIADQLCDNLNGITLNELGSSQNSLGLSLGTNLLVDTRAEEATLVNGVAAAAAAPSLFGSNSNPIISIISSGSSSGGNSGNSSGNITGDDHDTSFSKNGTEILDFEPNTCTTASNNQHTQNANTSMQQPQPPQLGYASMLMRTCDQLDINRWSLDNKLAALKTRRSNSLTTQTISTSSSSSNSSVITVNDNCSNSTENLAQFANKPRSFSLSIEHQRGGLTNSGSDTRLDEFKPNYIKFQTRNVGMSSIGLWLKSLRLHKYIELFKNMTYEEMLQIGEDYLQSLGVTKGASHKLALCIEKLKERAQILAKTEQELLSGQQKLQTAVEELAGMVLTPMKPIEAMNTGEENVALRFLKVIDLVCGMVQKDPYAIPDDEHINVIMWILDRSIHNEAFVNQANQLKELKFKMSKLKMSLVPKMHHIKNSAGSSLNKSRWSAKSRKCDSKNGSNDRINHRKNSSDMLNFSLGCLPQPHHHHGIQQGDYDKYHQMMHSCGGSGGGQHQYKSSSYPNFMSSQQHQQAKQQHHMHQQQPSQQQQMLQPHTHFPAQQQSQQQQHRRSLNNLIVVSGGPQQPQKMIFKPGQGMMPATTSSTDNLQMDSPLKTAQQQQQRKASLTGLNNSGGSSNGSLSNTFSAAVNNAANADSTQQQQQQQQQQAPKKTMAAVVMVSNDELVGQHIARQHQQQQQQQQQQSHLLINNNNSNMLNNNLLCQQQQQQLQLLAAAAAAVGNSCRGNNSMLNCLCNSSSNGGTNSQAGNNTSASNKSNSSSSISGSGNGSGSNCSNCCNRLTATTYEANATPLITNINAPLVKEKYHMMAPPNTVAAAMNDIKSLEQLETLCLQMTEQAIN